MFNCFNNCLPPGLAMSGIFALLPIIYRINGTVGAAMFDLLHPTSFRKFLNSLNIICNILLGSTRWYAREIE